MESCVLVLSEPVPAVQVRSSGLATGTRKESHVRSSDQNQATTHDRERGSESRCLKGIEMLDSSPDVVTSELFSLSDRGFRFTNHVPLASNGEGGYDQYSFCRLHLITVNPPEARRFGNLVNYQGRLCVWVDKCCLEFHLESGTRNVWSDSLNDLLEWLDGNEKANVRLLHEKNSTWYAGLDIRRPKLKLPKKPSVHDQFKRRRKTTMTYHLWYSKSHEDKVKKMSDKKGITVPTPLVLIDGVPCEYSYANVSKSATLPEALRNAPDLVYLGEARQYDIKFEVIKTDSDVSNA